MDYFKKIRKKYIPEISPLKFGDDRKVFCISFQRTGTTSVGNFFRNFGFRWAGWPADRRNDWSGSWYEGNYEKIFNSIEFKSSNAYEDSPWFAPGFYRILYHRFPHAKFILMTRDPDAWFQSMLKHSNGNVLGRSRIHSKIYRREDEFFYLLQSGAIQESRGEKNTGYEKTMKILPEHSEYYKTLYRLHTLEVCEFFNRHAPNSIFTAALEDKDKWVKLGEFLGIDVPENYESHENKSG